MSVRHWPPPHAGTTGNWSPMPIWKPIRCCVVLGTAAVSALAGCTNGTGEGSAEVAEDHATLMELSERATRAGEHAYTAEYLVEDTGDFVVVAVDPEAGTGAVVIDDRPELWAGQGPEELSDWLGGALAAVLPTGREVSSWLTASAEDPSAAAEFSDTTLAGELSDCVKVQGSVDSPVGVYEVCVTTVGVLASVSADFGDVAYTAKLVNYHDGVNGAWLDELADPGAHGDALESPGGPGTALRGFARQGGSAVPARLIAYAASQALSPWRDRETVG